MAFNRRKKRRPARSTDEVDDYDEAATNRLRSIGDLPGHTFSEDERKHVEARIRRMWYGAKREGSKAERENPDD